MRPEGLSTAGRDAFETHSPLPASATADFAHWGELLAKWNRKINLVAPSTLGDYWIRHALDSAQATRFIPQATQRIVDFGSGAGFPGLAFAIDAKHGNMDREVHLIESAGKKASFLRTVIRELGLEAVVHNDRIETIAPLGADIISARAFAPLPRLLPMAARHLAQDGQLVLLKGSTSDLELEEAGKDWRFDAVTHSSVTDAGGSVVVIGSLDKR